MPGGIVRVCDECGRCTADGEPGEAGTEHAHLWFCSQCWLAWDVADGQLPQEVLSGAPGPPPQQPQQRQQQQQRQRPSAAEEAPEGSEFLVSYEPPVDLPDVALLQGAAQRLVALPDAAAREEAMQTVFRLLDAILAAPEDIKKRKVKKGNATFHKKVGRHAAGLEVLRVAGFIEADDPEAEAAKPGSGQGALLVMPVAYVMRLSDAHHILASVATKAGLTAPPLPQVQGSSGIFNPSVSSQQATGVAPLTKKPVDGRSEAEKLREEVRRKERQLQEQAVLEPVPLRPAAFWLSAGRRLEDVVRETAQDAASTEEQAADKALLQEKAVASAAAISGAGGKFESADKARLAELSRNRGHGLCILRVVCPDKSVLQAHFRAGDRGEYVVAQLGPLLAAHVRSANWYVYQTPPLRRLAPKETLAAAGLTPGASLYLGFDGERPAPPFLEADLLAQLGPAPQEDERGVTVKSDGPPENGKTNGAAAAHPRIATLSRQTEDLGEE